MRTVIHRAGAFALLAIVATGCGGPPPPPLPGTGRWEAMASPPQGEAGAFLTVGTSPLFWTGTKVLVPSSSGLLAYDPASSAWSTLNGPPLDYGVDGTGCALAGDAFVTFGANACGPGTVDTGVSAICPIAQVYRLSTDSTKAMSQVGAPATRNADTVLSVGTQVLVWGGQAFTTTAPLENIIYGDGAVYDPDRDAWTAIAPNPASPPRGGYSAVWTGTEMLVWGGTTGPMVSETGPTAPETFQAAAAGAAYNLAIATWRTMAARGQPSAREGHVAVWTGSAMIVWGGGSYPNPSLVSAMLSDGAAYDPSADAWRPIRSAPEALLGAVAVWTGTEMLVWGGYTNHGYRYNPATDTWAAMTTAGAPSPRTPTGAVWTGDSFLVWGGYDDGDPPNSLSDGAQWFPDSTGGG
jgi:hypothetical protein